MLVGPRGVIARSLTTKFGCVVQIWILAAQFEVRQLRMVEARKILGMSLGMCPKDRTYKAYIEVGCPSLISACHCTWHCNQHNQLRLVYSISCHCDQHLATFV